MSHEIQSADSLLQQLADLRAELAQARSEAAAERDKRGTLERAVRAWAVEHPPVDCARCQALHALVAGAYADPVLAELDAARAVVAAAQDAVGTAERIVNSYALNPKPLRAALSAYDAVVKASK